MDVLIHVKGRCIARTKCYKLHSIEPKHLLMQRSFYLKDLYPGKQLRGCDVQSETGELQLLAVFKRVQHPSLSAPSR